MKKFLLFFSTASLCATLAFSGSCSFSSQLDPSDSQTTWQSTSGDINSSQNGGDSSSRGTSADASTSQGGSSVTSTSQGGSSVTSTSQNEDEIWHHYPAVAPTATRHGSREFWAKGNEGSSAPCFENPGVLCVDHDFSEYDSFFNLTSDDERYIAPGAATPTVNGSQITYGIYPQTVLEDNDGLYATLNANASLYATFNVKLSEAAYSIYKYYGEFYAKVSATPCKTNYTFDNGTTIEKDTIYWFKCEPIAWNILSNNSGNYYVVSSLLLDAHCYSAYLSSSDLSFYLNNYRYSDIREWLNGDFYNSAFALGNSYIQTTTVDNSASTTDYSSNIYACENTQDKVFLPSFQDYINSSYGFSTSNLSTGTRCCRTTDWARARYAVSTGSGSNGSYWTRSPCSGHNVGAWYVDNTGNLDFDYVYRSTKYHSVRPSLTITIE